MKSVRLGVAIALLVIVAAVIGYVVFGRASGPDHVAVYYVKLDGRTAVPWTVSLGPARDAKSVAFYAATQAVAGPAPDVAAIRFPPGTIVRHVDVDGANVTVDLGGAVAKRSDGGSFAESGEFKALIWTMTALPGITGVQVEIEGETVAALPGGQFELDAPLSRSSF